jgi:NADH-quinone oxidoreductase subunit J
MSSTIGFGLVAAVILISAFFVVRSKQLIHAVLWLSLTLLGTAGLYGMLNAPFLAGVQVLTYIGGVVTLMVFGVMVTRRHDGVDAPASSDPDEKGFIFALALFVVLALATWKSPIVETIDPVAPTTAQLARLLLDTYLLPFELLSLLLLAAIVGAVVLARRKDPDPLTREEPTSAPRRVVIPEVSR